MKKPTIEEMWQDFRSLVVPADASETQVRESRICFYAGFFSMMQINIAIGHEAVPEDIGFKYLNDLNSELEEFMKPYKGRVKP